MRIIAGKFKGRQLAPLGGAELRPTLDRVRESVFNILTGRTPGARVLDLFAGTGAVGLEALSRGAERVVFVEPAREAQSLIRKNMEKCGVDAASATLLSCTAQKALGTLARQAAAFDLVYVDPPFDAGLYEPTLKALAESPVVHSGSWVLAEHFHKAVLEDSYGRLIRFDLRRMGDTSLSFYGLEEDINPTEI